MVKTRSYYMDSSKQRIVFVCPEYPAKEPVLFNLVILNRNPARKPRTLCRRKFDCFDIAQNRLDEIAELKKWIPICA